MTVPTEANYPITLDNDTSLFGDWKNAVSLTLKTAIGSIETSFYVNESIDEIAVPLFLVFNSGEIVHCAGKDTLAKAFTGVTRGAGGTSVQEHLDGEGIYLAPVAEYHNMLKQAILAIEQALGASPQGAYASVSERFSLMQGSGNGFDADKVDGLHGADLAGLLWTNKSGGAVSPGDVAIYSSDNDISFTTTSIKYDHRFAGVVIDSAANDGQGRLQNKPGTLVYVNCDASAVAVGDRLVTSSTPKLATVAYSSYCGNAFAIALSGKAAGANGQVIALLSSEITQKKYSANGVVGFIGNDLEVYLNGSDMVAHVKTGAAWLEKFLFTASSESTVTLDTADNSYGRYDVVALELDIASGTCGLTAITGTPAASPTIPALSQTSALFQLPLASIYVGPGVTVVTSSVLADMRTFAQGVISIPFVIGTGTSAVVTGPMPVAIPLGTKCRIVRWELLANTAGSLVLDIYKGAYADNPLSASSSIISSGKPTLSSVQKAEGSPTASMWPGKTLNANDYLLINVDSASIVKQVALTLFCVPE